MRRVVVNGSLVRWLRLVLVLGVVVAAWGPAHSVEVAAFDHGVDSATHSHPASGHDDHRCGHRDAEREATQVTVVRVAPPSVVNGPAVAVPVGGTPGPVVADLDGSRAPPGRLLSVVCVWRQ
jgi:hypothetical protein